MDMMMRRRAMMAGIALPEWDYEWNHADGLPTDNGMIRNSSGTYTETEETGGLLLKAADNSMCFYRFPDTEMTTGVLETDFWMSNLSNATTGARALIRIGNSTAAITLIFGYFSGRHIKLWNASSLAGGTNIGTYSYRKSYNVRIEIDNGLANIIITNRTDNTIAAQVSNHALDAYYPGITQFGAQNAGNTGVHWHYFRLKKDRLT